MKSEFLIFQIKSRISFKISSFVCSFRSQAKKLFALDAKLKYLFWLTFLTSYPTRMMWMKVSLALRLT